MLSLVDGWPLTIAIALLAFMAPVFADEAITLGPDCVLELGPPHAVVRVIDAETIRLDDTSEVRLIGALAPRAPDAAEPDADASEWPPERDAKAALTDMVMGRRFGWLFPGGGPTGTDGCWRTFLSTMTERGHGCRASC